MKAEGARVKLSKQFEKGVLTPMVADAVDCVTPNGLEAFCKLK